MPYPRYPTVIIHCPDCDVECNFVANCLAEMPLFWPGTYHPHQKGSQECLERQVRNLKTRIKQLTEQLIEEVAGEKYLIHLWFSGSHGRHATVIGHSPEEAVQRVQVYEPDGGWEHASVEIITRVRASRTARVLAVERFDKQEGLSLSALTETEVIESEDRRPQPATYRLCWKMKHSSVVRIVTSKTLKDLALVYDGLITRRVEMKTLELRVWDRTAELYKSIPFPANWKEVIKRATYGKAEHLKCPVCGNVDLIEENILGICELCCAHSGRTFEMEPFEAKNDATRTPATGSQICAS